VIHRAQSSKLHDAPRPDEAVAPSERSGHADINRGPILGPNSVLFACQNPIYRPS